MVLPLDVLKSSSDFHFVIIMQLFVANVMQCRETDYQSWAKIWWKEIKPQPRWARSYNKDESPANNLTFISNKFTGQFACLRVNVDITFPLKGHLRHNLFKRLRVFLHCKALCRRANGEVKIKAATNVQHPQWRPYKLELPYEIFMERVYLPTKNWGKPE